VATPDNRLWSLDARTGRPCTGFGEQGAVDLLVGLGVVAPGSYAVTSPPVVTHGRIVVGAAVQDNFSLDMPSGVVRAYDALTGQLAWAWDAGRPDRRGAPPPDETYTRSTPNAWAPLVADDALGLVYVPTGNPAGDFWGANRRPFDERYGVSLVALDVATGTVRWHFQTTHHDVWDNDLCAQPVLVDLPGEAGPRHAVIIGTKQGDLYVLDRATGEPIVPLEERPAPGPSDIGEPLARTQPASALALNPGVPRLTEQSLWGLTPLDQMWCRIQFRSARYEGPYTPPGISRPSIFYPGMFGGIEWGGVAVDPERRILIANPSALPFIFRMARVRNPAAGAGRTPDGTSGGLVETLGTGYATFAYAFLSPLGLPCMQPPWGKLYAIDLDTWRPLWERPVGTARDTGPFGIATHLPLLIGTPQVGGTLITRGGLIFAGATLDRYLRAYDLRSGRELWKARLPAGGQATPMSYEADGRQFVLIAAGGHGTLGTKAGDYLLAYALDAPAEPGSASAEH
jgi:quinoprotein glucose dehydrogenase